MEIRSEQNAPQVDPDAWVAPTAVLSGDVRVGPGSCMLHGAVLNADGGAVQVGANCVIMENAVLRGTPRLPLTIGDHVLAGPNSYLTGATIGDEARPAASPSAARCTSTAWCRRRPGSRSAGSPSAIPPACTRRARRTTSGPAWRRPAASCRSCSVPTPRLHGPSRCAPPCAATPATCPAPTRPTSRPARKDDAMRIAVTGASGQIGGEVVRLLAAGQQHKVVALIRRPPAAGQFPDGVQARQADYADEQALADALDGVATLVLVSSDGPVADVIVHHRNVIRAAARRGVAHIVALSGLDASLDSPFCYAVGYGYTEQLLAESGCPVSLARASIYTEFFLAFLTRARASGQLRLPAADGCVSFVSRDDVARSLAALATAPPASRPQEITGPEALDLAALAALA